MGTLLKIHELTKIFPGQVALDSVDLEIETGSTHALVGQNGSGKSTLIKVLCGFHQPTGDSSAEYYPQSITETASLDNPIPLRLGDGKAAASAGIRFVHQDLGLVDTFNAVENISMGVGYTKRFAGSIDWKADRKRAQEGLESLGFPDIDVNVPVGLLAPSQKTAVAIARALHDWDKGASILVLDEPTASLDPEVGDFIRSFLENYKKENKISILLASHNMNEVTRLCKTVLMMKDGAITVSYTHLTLPTNREV